MSTRFPRTRILVSAVALALLALPQAAPAQQAPLPAPPPGHAVEPMQPPKDLPRPPRGDRVRNLDFLFGALKVAPDEATSRQVESRIWALWLASGSDTANLLMSRVKAATDAEDLDLAIKLLDAVIKIKPNYVEAWNRRATVHYLKKDYAASLGDIQQVLKREPRHFGAMSGLGMILQEFGDEKSALEVFRRALAINPHLAKIPDMVKTLTEKVEGRDI